MSAHLWSDKNAVIFDDQLLELRGDQIYATEPFALFLGPLAERFGAATFLARASSAGDANYPLPLSARLLALPHYSSIPALCRRFPAYARANYSTLRCVVQKADVLFLHWPHPLSLLLIRIAAQLQTRIPICLLARANMQEVVKHRYARGQRLSGLLLVRALNASAWLYRRNLIVLAAGRELADTYERLGFQTRCTSFSYLHRLGDAQPARTRACDEGRQLRLLYVGRLEPEKGVRYLLEALSLLNSAGHRFELDVAGAGEDEPALRAATVRLGVADCVNFLGHVPFGSELLKVYQRADMVVLPSLAEGLPHVLLEAVALDKPVIATRVGAVDSVLRERENGWLVEPASAQELAQAIGTAARGPGSHNGVRASAAQCAVTRDSIPDVFQALNDWITQAGFHAARV